MGFPRPQTGTVTEDEDVVGGFITASGNANYYVGDDTGDWTAQTLSGSYGTLVIDEDGVWTYSADNSQASIQALDSGDTLTETFTITATGGTTTVTITIEGADEPPCFTRGTLIDTPHGPRPVEEIRAGDMVLTADCGPQPVRWIGSRRIALDGLDADPALRPVRIREGAIAPGVPERDMLVSPMHRVVLQGLAPLVHFGRSEVLAPARHLVNGRGIFIDTVAEVEYFHLLFDQHQILTSHGLASESFYPGGVGLDAFEEGTRDEVLGLFPELRAFESAYGPAARPVLKAYEAVLMRESVTPAPLLRRMIGARAA